MRKGTSRITSGLRIHVAPTNTGVHRCIAGYGTTMDPSVRRDDLQWGSSASPEFGEEPFFWFFTDLRDGNGFFVGWAKRSVPTRWSFKTIRRSCATIGPRKAAGKHPLARRLPRSPDAIRGQRWRQGTSPDCIRATKCVASSGVTQGEATGLHGRSCRSDQFDSPRGHASLCPPYKTRLPSRRSAKNLFFAQASGHRGCFNPAVRDRTMTERNARRPLLAEVV